MNQLTSSTQIDADTIQTWLVEQIAQQLGAATDEIDIRAPFDSYGLDSAQGASIVTQGEQLLGIDIPLILLMHYPTIQSLSQRLAEEFAESDLEIDEI